MNVYFRIKSTDENLMFVIYDRRLSPVRGNNESIAEIDGILCISDVSNLTTLILQ